MNNIVISTICISTCDSVMITIITTMDSIIDL